MRSPDVLSDLPRALPGHTSRQQRGYADLMKAKTPPSVDRRQYHTKLAWARCDHAVVMRLRRWQMKLRTAAFGAKRPSAGSALPLGCGTNPTAIAARCTVVIQVQEGARLKYGVHSYDQSVRENRLTIGYRSGSL